jgi:hypothetical protein
VRNWPGERLCKRVCQVVKYKEEEQKEKKLGKRKKEEVGK